jgi:cobalt-zinc-cadmium efflux system membrane fusion protein
MIKNTWLKFAIILFLIIVGQSLFATEKHDDNENTVKLTKESQKMAGVGIANLKPQILKIYISAPGEVTPNTNLSTKVTTRVSAQVVQRYVQEGQHVKKGQVLVKMSSVDMAKTQSDLLLASQEWERVKSLGKDAISGKRYYEAQVNYQRAYSTALAYGMTETEINELLVTQKPTRAQGEFNILAPQDGTIFDIKFTDGELIEPGRILLQVINEGSVWVNAKLPPSLVSPIKISDGAQVRVANQVLPGRVIQVYHQLDEVTRTRSVLIEVQNSQDLLHPGQFVNCMIESGKTQPVLALPEEAIVRTIDGDKGIYVEKKEGLFQLQEIKVLEVINKQAVIEGVPAGTLVVTKGVFFVHSELNKKGFDAHGD